MTARLQRSVTSAETLIVLMRELCTAPIITYYVWPTGETYIPADMLCDMARDANRPTMRKHRSVLFEDTGAIVHCINWNASPRRTLRGVHANLVYDPTCVALDSRRDVLDHHREWNWMEHYLCASVQLHLRHWQQAYPV